MDTQTTVTGKFLEREQLEDEVIGPKTTGSGPITSVSLSPSVVEDGVVLIVRD
jgi:hypothetical protein